MKNTNKKSNPVSIGCLVIFLLFIVWGIFLAAKYAPSKEDQERINATMIAERKYENLREEAIKICQGDGGAISKADPYTNPSQAAHPIMIITDKGYDYYSEKVYELEQSWKPIDPEQVQLVGCVKLEWEEIESCRYVGAVAIRQKPKVIISVYEALSGKLVDTVWFMGLEPRECQGVESFSEGSTTKYISPNPEFETSSMIEVLKPYVTP